MIKVSVYEAKTQLSKYLALLSSGEEKEIIITKSGKEVARLVPPAQKKRRLGIGAEMFGAFDCDVNNPAFGDIAKEFGYE